MREAHSAEAAFEEAKAGPFRICGGIVRLGHSPEVEPLDAFGRQRLAQGPEREVSPVGVPEGVFAQRAGVEIEGAGPGHQGQAAGDGSPMQLGEHEICRTGRGKRVGQPDQRLGGAAVEPGARARGCEQPGEEAVGIVVGVAINPGGYALAPGPTQEVASVLVEGRQERVGPVSKIQQARRSGLEIDAGGPQSSALEFRLDLVGRQAIRSSSNLGSCGAGIDLGHDPPLVPADQADRLHELVECGRAGRVAPVPHGSMRHVQHRATERSWTHEDLCDAANNSGGVSRDQANRMLAPDGGHFGPAPGLKRVASRVFGQEPVPVGAVGGRRLGRDHAAGRSPPKSRHFITHCRSRGIRGRRLPRCVHPTVRRRPE